ncbi:hypothetical protein AJ80_10014 [Polytolypa hystricis UAMH7299]|uniref:Uncharacterized protein n=1 Tax=Polytolypa hystricis (strain UAMH7299) TaxID=1447883 RepID=A0A2B7WEZ4_POLH7|nr:hypothetical protein AJ80_10014 [Polytolypa hystricis UAMH7299]
MAVLNATQFEPVLTEFTATAYSQQTFEFTSMEKFVNCKFDEIWIEFIGEYNTFMANVFGKYSINVSSSDTCLILGLSRPVDLWVLKLLFFPTVEVLEEGYLCSAVLCLPGSFNEEKDTIPRLDKEYVMADKFKAFI